MQGNSQADFNGTIGRTVKESRISYKSKKNSGTKSNVLYIVLDDMGFADLGCYGSEINTPNIDRIAARGLRYNNFHTTAICSATRASLLTGCNHHEVGVGAVVHVNTGCPNGIGHIDRSYATIAEILKENGYRTFISGKWHLTDQCNPAGPYDEWPLGRGFERFFGYLPAMTDQYCPSLTIDNTVQVQREETAEGYHLSEDLTDHAIEYIYNSKMEDPDTPFFLYLAYGAVHFPHHAPSEYVDRYRGKYDEGWDVIRERRFRKQKELGIIPENAELTDRNELVPPWDDLSTKEKKLYAKYMEVYAGFLEHTDEQIGRVLDYLEKIGQLDHTIIVLLSDNGTESGGGISGKLDMTTSMSIINTPEEVADEVDFAYDHMNLLGGRQANNLYPIGWANVGNTPFQWYKTWVHEGGVKDPLIISCPEYVDDFGGIRGQYVHVSDITPTVLELLDIEKPEILRGIPQKPMSGVSFAYSLSDKNAKSRKTVQYYEMLGNRGIYKDGWKAVVNHAFHDDYKHEQWELYHVAEDYSEKYDVAAQYPEKLEELKEEWLIQAGKYGVFPLLPGPAHTKRGKTPQDMTAAMEYPEETVEFLHVILPYTVNRKLHIYNNSFQIEASVKIQEHTNGVILCYGQKYQGFTIYIKENELFADFALGNLQMLCMDGPGKLGQGVKIIRLTIDYDPQITWIRLIVDGKVVNEKQIQLQIKRGQSMYLASNPYSAISDNYQIPFVFNSAISYIKIDTAESSINAKEEIDDFFEAD